jgi:hypothetical protein
MRQALVSCGKLRNQLPVRKNLCRFRDGYEEIG